MTYLNDSFYDRVQDRLTALEGGSSIPTSIQTALDGKANTSHTHSIANVTGLQAALDAKASSSDLSSGLSGKANSSHTHAISDITNLQTSLDAKASTSSLTSGLAGKTDTATTTSLASRVTSLETWRGAKAAAKSNVTTSYSVPTAVITLGLNAPTASGINSIINTIMAEINGIYDVLRTREIMAV